MRLRYPIFAKQKRTKPFFFGLLDACEKMIEIEEEILDCTTLYI